MNKAIILLLIVNTAIGLVFLLTSLFRKTGRTRYASVMNSLLIIFCPILGLVILLSVLIARKLLHPKKIDMSDISFSHQKSGAEIIPDEGEEMRITPLQDMFLVGDNLEKRRAIFFALKQDMDNYLSTISIGIADDDSETSHYAASSLMKYTSDFNQKIQPIAVLYEQAPSDYEVNRTYADSVFTYLSAQTVMTEMTRKKYQYLYCDLMENLAEQHEEQLTPADCCNVVRMRLALKNPDSAEKWMHDCRRLFPNREESYMIALEYFFRTGRSAEFKACMEELKASEIVLSAESLNLIRFFSGRKAVV